MVIERQQRGVDAAYISAENHERFLKGKTAVVVNDADSIGIGIVEALAREGVSGIIGIHPEKAMEAGTRKREKIKVTVGMDSWRESVPVDLADSNNRQRLGAEINISFKGKLDILVINDSDRTKDTTDNGLNTWIDEFFSHMKRSGEIVFVKRDSEDDEEQLLKVRVAEIQEKDLLFFVLRPSEISTSSEVGEKVVGLLKQ